MRKFDLLIKRVFDILFSSVLLLFLSPVFLLIYLVILLTMGQPVLFKQKRLGLNGKPFDLYKFRSMTADLDRNGELLPDGQRLTRIGRFLRSTTLDELPELVNVCKGDMSLVGPRPLLVEYREFYTPEQWRRHEMPPGMAGPAVASGRNTLSWEEKFKLDVDYVDQWSLGLDLSILFRTMIAVLKREGVQQPGQETVVFFDGRNSGEHDENSLRRQ